MIKKVQKAIGSPWGQRITILVLICIIMAILEPIFLRPTNAKSILLAISINGIMACGMLFTVLVGGLDFSVGSLAGFSASTAFLVATRYGFSDNGFLFGCAVAILACIAVGFINGFFVTRFEIPAFIITLAMRYAIYGASYFITSGFYVYAPGRGLAFELGNANILSIPMPVIIFVIIVIICAVVLGKTTFGRRLYAIGGNKHAANLAGFNASRNTILAFIISSVAAGIGGIILASMNTQAGQPTGLGYEGNVLMAMVVGGINLAGGEGGIPGAVFGALLVGVINNAMLLLSISADYQTFVQGVVILAAMSLNMYTKRGMSGSFKFKFKPFKPKKTES